MRTNIPPSVADTSIVICKMIAGGLASLFEGGGICEANGGGSAVCTMGNSLSHGLRRASPLSEGARKCAPQKRDPPQITWLLIDRFCLVMHRITKESQRSEYHSAVTCFCSRYMRCPPSHFVFPKWRGVLSAKGQVSDGPA